LKDLTLASGGLTATATAFEIELRLLEVKFQRPGGQRPPVSRPPADAPAAAGTSTAQDRTQAAASTAQQSAPADPGQQSLDADTIRHLHTSLRALPRPQLESLTRAFRKRFQVPEEAVTIADRINQKCHHDWIEAFLVQVEQVAG
jgi:hypothetical protein